MRAKRRCCPLPRRRYIESMNTTTASVSFRSRGVERTVRGQPTSDGDGVRLTRVLTQPLQRRFARSVARPRTAPAFERGCNSHPFGNDHPQP